MTFKTKLDKITMELVFSRLINDNTISNNIQLPELTDDLMNEMLNNSVIKSCINSLIKGIDSRELIIKSEEETKEDKNILEIQKRFNNIKNKNTIIGNIVMAAFKGMSVHEIVYNEDFTIKKLVYIPNNIIRYKTDDGIFTMRTKEGEIELTDKFKWLISIYKEGVGARTGYSLLKDVLLDYMNIKNINTKISNIVNKYGDTILIFAYGVEQSEEDVRETAESLRRAHGQNVLAIPLSDGNLKDNLFTIRLSDIDTSIHERLLKMYENNIRTVLLGGSLTMDTGEGTSSYALGKVHQSEKEKIEDSLALFVRDELDKLIEKDAYIWGYDKNMYYVSIERKENEEEVLEIEKKKKELRQLEINGILTLSQAGYELDEEELKEIIGYNTIKKKELTT